VTSNPERCFRAFRAMQATCPTGEEFRITRDRIVASVIGRTSMFLQYDCRDHCVHVCRIRYECWIFDNKNLETSPHRAV